MSKFYCFHRLYLQKNDYGFLKMMPTSCQQPENEAIEVAREARRPRDHINFTYSRAPFASWWVLLLHWCCRRRLQSWWFWWRRLLCASYRAESKITRESNEKQLKELHLNPCTSAWSNWSKGCCASGLLTISWCSYWLYLHGSCGVVTATKAWRTLIRTRNLRVSGGITTTLELNAGVSPDVSPSDKLVEFV